MKDVDGGFVLDTFDANLLTEVKDTNVETSSHPSPESKICQKLVWTRREKKRNNLKATFVQLLSKIEPKPGSID